MISSYSSARMLVGCCLVAILGCGHGPGEHGSTEKKELPLLELKTLTLELTEWPMVVRVQGNLQADETATLSSRVAGFVSKVNVDRGHPVKAGDVLVELRMIDFDLKVDQAKAALNQTRSRLGLREGQKDSELDPVKSPPVREVQAVLNESLARYERARSLRGSAATTEEEVQALKAAIEVNQARYQSALNQVRETMATLTLNHVDLALAEQARTDAVIRAPFDGVVEQRPIAPGTYVLAGTPLLTLVRTDPLRFTAGVPERRALMIQADQDVRIVMEGQEQPLLGKVSRRSPALTMNSRALTVEVDVRNPGNKIPANFFAEADIYVDSEARTLAIPLAALSEFAGVEKVWIVQNGEVSERRVRTGRRDFQRVEILEGLRPGDTILAEAQLGRPGKIAQPR